MAHMPIHIDWVATQPWSEFGPPVPDHGGLHDLAAISDEARSYPVASRSRAAPWMTTSP